MRIGLVDGPGQHGPLMRRLLEELGHEIVYTSAHPTFAASHEARRSDRVAHDLVRRFAASAQHRLGLKTAWDFDVYTRLYGRLAARYVAGCDAVIGFSFVARESHRRAKVSVLELPATHIAVHERIVDEEHARAGRPRARRMSRFSIARAEAEYAQADLIEVLSSYAKRTLVERGVDGNKIVVSPLGVDLERFRPSAQRAGPFRVLCVGRVELAKGIRPLMQACGSLSQMELTLVGSVADEARPLVRDCVVKPPMAIDQLAEQYRQAEVLAFPTLSDGMGLVMLEAMASGIPVVAGDRSGAPDIIHDGEDGFVVPSGDAEALADRLAWLRDHPDSRREMGKRARAAVEARFGEAAYGRRLAQLIERLPDRDGSRAAPGESARSPSLP